MNTGAAAGIDRRLAPWLPHLGADHTAYRNHVLRVLAFCDALHAASPLAAGEPAPSTTEAYLTAAAFHDLGIWSAGTFDYLAPSVALARTWLHEHDCAEDLPAPVTAMIQQHHKLRSAGSPSTPVEIFRRADVTDVSLGGVRFGVPRAHYRAVCREWPNAGFHRRLVTLTIARARRHPGSPLPMVKW
ncbi:MAG: phosphohydrolase [Actinomycetota bacterium]